MTWNKNKNSIRHSGDAALRIGCDGASLPTCNESAISKREIFEFRPHVRSACMCARVCGLVRVFVMLLALLFCAFCFVRPRIMFH